MRNVERNDGVLIFDDTIQEKAWTDESELMCWHYDHCSGRSVKGINQLNAFSMLAKCLFQWVKKPFQYSDLKTRKVKRKSEITKNEMMRQMIETCIHNNLKFLFILMDSWFLSKNNFDFITSNDKHFIAALKSNKLIALSDEDRKNKRFVGVDELNFPEQTAVQGWLKGYAKAVLLVRQVFTHKDGSTGILHLVCSDLTCDYNAITTIYKRRWKVEVFHKSLKSNANQKKSPTRTVRTQSNHIFMSICAAFKLESLSIKNNLNPFAICRKLLINTSPSIYAEFRQFQAAA
ncbi:transposase [Shewanella surugensis]|uniref:Transposase n=1 Tax=Shewanella surugensis TaxID=212020 RepID=A0ABT0LJ31_9GAMM|nr:transposase [Shewanella surugensis]MCL1127302.1 transposase [Shewanella surugensis]